MKKIYLPIILVLLLGTIACKKERNADMGSLVGYVQLITADGKESDDNSGVKVKATDKIEDATNSDGRFEMEDLTSLYNYDITYSKAGYTSFTDFQYMIFGGENVKNTISLYEKPQTQISYLGVEFGEFWYNDNFVVGKLSNIADYDTAEVVLCIQLSKESNSNVDTDDREKKYTVVDILEGDTVIISMPDISFDVENGDLIYGSLWVVNRAVNSWNSEYENEIKKEVTHVGVSEESKFSFVYNEDYF